MTPTDTVVSEERLRSLLQWADEERGESILGSDIAYYRDAKKAFAELLDRRTATPQSGGVVVKGLKWVKHPTADLWRADNLLGRYQVYAVINIVSWAFDAHDGLTRSSGDAASVDEAKAAAQKDYEQRILSALEPRDAR